MGHDQHDQCVMFADSAERTHNMSLLQAGPDILVDSGSTLTTVGSSEVLTSYVAPSTSTSGIKMRSVTGQMVCPAGEGRLQFTTNDGHGSLSVLCHHTTVIKSSTFSPAETCDQLNYNAYHLTCDRRRSTSLVQFTKEATPGITIHGHYLQGMPFISLSSASVQSIHSVVWMAYSFTSASNDTSIHQVLRLLY
jgi:hypothetical protein